MTTDIGHTAEAGVCLPRRNEPAPAGNTPPRPGYRDALTLASYRAAHLSAPAALALLLLAAVLVAGVAR